MLLNNRRMYINRYSNSKGQSEEKSNSFNESKDDQKDVKDLILDTFKSISENISGIKQSIAMLNEKIDKLEARQISLEDQIDNDYPERRIVYQPDLSSDKNEQETCKANTIDMYKENTNNKPLMPGSGFSNITPEFLRNLNKK